MTEQQQDELIALDAIYPGCVDAHGDSVTLSIPIQLGDQHLPPLRATVRLPPTYPDDVPPVVTDISSDWLDSPTLRAVQDKLPELWVHEPVLWSWWEWVGTGSFLSDLGIDLSSLPTDVQARIANFDADATQAEFLDQAFACGICFESKKGGRCVKLPCGCVFCQECIVAFWSLAIKEGAVDSVVCPSVECVKERRALDASTVESVVGPEATKRWQNLSEKRLVDRDKRYCFCPREMCEALVSPKEEVKKPALAPAEPRKAAIRLDIGRSDEPKRPAMSDASRWDNYRQCGKCDYSFCYLCRALWHGAHTPCDIRDTHRAVREYLDADEAGKRSIEHRLGQRNTEALFALIRDYEREQEALKWMEEHTTPCPCCKAQIEKSEGCNHMSCTRCRSHFCYRCGKTLSAADPYKHFQQPGSCYQKLFDYDPNAGAWVHFDAAWF